MFNPLPISPEAHEAWFAQRLREDSNRSQILSLERRPVGIVTFDPVKEESSLWEWGIYLGEVNTPVGTGTRFACKALNHAFETLNAEAILSEALSENCRALSLYERLGFQRQGVRRLKRPGTAVEVEVVRLVLGREDWQDPRADD